MYKLVEVNSRSDRYCVSLVASTANLTAIGTHTALGECAITFA